MTLFLTIDDLNGGEGSGDNEGAFPVASFSVSGSKLADADSLGKPQFGDAFFTFEGLAVPFFEAVILPGGGTPSTASLQSLTPSGRLDYELGLGEIGFRALGFGWGGGELFSFASVSFDEIGLETSVAEFGYDIARAEAIGASDVGAAAPEGRDVFEERQVEEFFLKIDGLNGGSTATGHKGAFEIDSFSATVANPNAGPIQKSSVPEFLDLSVSFGGLSTSLLSELTTGTPLDAVQLQGVDANGTVVYDIRLSDALVSSYSASGIDGQNLFSNVSFAFSEIGIITDPAEFGYSLLENKEVNASDLSEARPGASDGFIEIPDTDDADLYLNIAGVADVSDSKGSAAGDAKGWIDLTSFSVAATRSVSVDGGRLTSSAPILSDVTATAEGLSEAALAQFLAGVDFERASIEVVDDDDEVLVDLRLGGAGVNSVNAGGVNGASPFSSFNVGVDELGVITSAGGEFGFSDTEKRAISPTDIQSPGSLWTTDDLELNDDTVVEQYFLAIDSKTGGAATADSKGVYEINALDLAAFRQDFGGITFGATQQFSFLSRPTFSDIILTLDGIIPTALGDVVSPGTLVGSARIFGIDGDGDEVFDLSLGGVDVSSFSVSGANGGNPETELALSFRQVGLETDDFEVGFDLTTFAVIDPSTIGDASPGGPLDLAGTNAATYFLGIEGLDGGQGSGAFKGWIEVEAIDLGATQVGAAAFIDPISVVLNGLSPEFFTLMSEGSLVDALTIVGLDAQDSVAFELRVKDALLSTVNVTAFSDGGDGPFTTLSIDGSSIGIVSPTTDSGFDRVENKEISGVDVEQAVPGGPDVLETEAADAYFLLIDDVAGTSTAPGFKGWFDIEGVSFGGGIPLDITLGGGGSVKPFFTDVSVTLSDVSPDLFNELIDEERADAARIVGVDSKGAVIYDLRLGEVATSSKTVSEAAGDAPFSTLSLNPIQIGLSTEESSFAFDLSTNETFSFDDIPVPTAGDGGGDTGDKPDPINLTPGNDTFQGGDDDENIDGGGGNDFILGRGGDDTIEGGDGFDTIRGNDGDDELSGGNQGDTLQGFDDDDLLEGGQGNDRLLGGSGDDTLLGGAGTDNLQGDQGDDLIEDTEGRSIVIAGAGDDTVTTGAENDVIRGGKDDDLIDAGAGNDSVTAFDGDDTVTGGAGNDTIEGEDGNDSLFGNDGVDRIDAGKGDDFLDGGDGRDTVNGKAGDDTIFGGDGDDRSNAGIDDDLVDMGAGNDSVRGGRGDDTITGGTGDDTIALGADDNLVIFRKGDGNDLIEDFGRRNTDNEILLSGFGTAFDTGAEVLGAATQVGASVLIDFGDGDSIRLAGFRREDLAEDDFSFA